ncbi:MAG TPA: hypothetical protein DCX77_03790 [Acidimicrobiaceae bacterium]|nr:hypothetical protein [Acidimicrobiaceae bacterium]
MTKPLTSSNSDREWLSFEDPAEHRTWLFDITFLASAWTCIYGAGCPGVEPEPAPEKELGCCTHGAYISDDQDLKHVREQADRLTSELWQYKEHAEAVGGGLWQDDEGWWRTRVVEGACIFQNRPEHPNGAGCAFHHLALSTGDNPMEVKPEICWQAPIRREDHETVTGHIYTMVREWERRDWGGEETDIWWWCTSDSQAHVGATPVYQQMEAELAAICGPTVYGWLRSELERRKSASSLLPHPTVRRT